MKTKLFVLILPVYFLVGSLLAAPVAAQAPAPSLDGTVAYRATTTQPEATIPGVTVYLVNPMVGRSHPEITDLYGRFSFESVPHTPDGQNWYYVEIYWGRDLIYRRAVQIFPGSEYRFLVG